MVSVGRGECDQPTPVEIYTIEMDEVRILIRILAAGAEPDLAILFIDAVDASNDILTLRNLVLDLPFLRVDQIQVTPPVPLRGINELVRFLQPIHVMQIQTFRVGRPDEGVGLFIN